MPATCILLPFHFHRFFCLSVFWGLGFFLLSFFQLPLKNRVIKIQRDFFFFPFQMALTSSSAASPCAVPGAAGSRSLWKAPAGSIQGQQPGPREAAFPPAGALLSTKPR